MVIVVVIRCKQLASCLAKEEEAQVKQVIPYIPVLPLLLCGNG